MLAVSDDFLQRASAIVQRFPGIERNRFLTQLLGDLPTAKSKRLDGRVFKGLKQNAERALKDLVKAEVIELVEPSGVHASWRVYPFGKVPAAKPVTSDRKVAAFPCKAYKPEDPDYPGIPQLSSAIVSPLRPISPERAEQVEKQERIQVECERSPRLAVRTQSTVQTVAQPKKPSRPKPSRQASVTPRLRTASPADAYDRAITAISQAEQQALQGGKDLPSMRKIAALAGLHQSWFRNQSKDAEKAKLIYSQAKARMLAHQNQAKLAKLFDSNPSARPGKARKGVLDEQLDAILQAIAAAESEAIASGQYLPKRTEISRLAVGNDWWFQRRTDATEQAIAAYDAATIRVLNHHKQKAQEQIDEFLAINPGRASQGFSRVLQTIEECKQRCIKESKPFPLQAEIAKKAGCASTYFATKSWSSKIARHSYEVARQEVNAAIPVKKVDSRKVFSVTKPSKLNEVLAAIAKAEAEAISSNAELPSRAAIARSVGVSPHWFANRKSGAATEATLVYEQSKFRVLEFLSQQSEESK